MSFSHFSPVSSKAVAQGHTARSMHAGQSSVLFALGRLLLTGGVLMGFGLLMR